MATGVGRGGVGKLEASVVPKMVDTQQQKHQKQQQQKSDVSHGSTDDQQQSDAVHEYTCSPCSQIDVTTDATHYCPECDVCYCKACLCDHVVMGRSKITQWGKAATEGAGNHTQDDDQESSCLRHPGHQVTMYCVDHDVLCCPLCSSSDHRSCKNMEKLPVAAQKGDIATNVQYVEAEIASLERNTEILAKDSGIRKAFVESSHTNYTRRLNEIQEKINTKFDGIKQTALDCKEHYIGKFNTDTLMCKSITEKLIGLKRALEPTEDDKKRFMKVKRVQQWVKDKQGEMKAILNSNVTEVFQNIPRVREASALKVITDVIGVKMAEMKFPLETNEDAEKCELVGLCQLANGHIIIADNANRCLKQLDQAYSVISRYQIEDTPRGICAIGDSEVAVAMDDKKILVVAVGTTFETVRTLEFDHPCMGVAYHNEQLFITYTPPCLSSIYGPLCRCKTKIHTYDKSGNSLRQMTADVGKHDYSASDNGTPICISKDGEKIYVAHRCGLAILDSQGGEITSSQNYTRDSDNQTYVIKFTNIVDSQGFVYALIEGSKEIVKISQEGRKFKQIQTVNFSMNETPGSFFYDKRLSRLVMCPQVGSNIYLQKHTY